MSRPAVLRCGAFRHRSRTSLPLSLPLLSLPLLSLRRG